MYCRQYYTAKSDDISVPQEEMFYFLALVLKMSHGQRECIETVLIQGPNVPRPLLLLCHEAEYIFSYLQLFYISKAVKMLLTGIRIFNREILSYMNAKFSDAHTSTQAHCDR